MIKTTYLINLLDGTITIPSLNKIAILIDRHIETIGVQWALVDTVPSRSPKAPLWAHMLAIEAMRGKTDAYSLSHHTQGL